MIEGNEEISYFGMIALARAVIATSDDTLALSLADEIMQWDDYLKAKGIIFKYLKKSP